MIESDGNMNIVLIGMPGCGKSTVGVLLAKALLFDFTDTDLVIQTNYGKSLCEIIDEYGTDEFKNIENRIVSGLEFRHTVVATGGSVVYGSDAMRALKKGAVTVYLKLSPSDISERIKNIKTRGIAMKPDCTIEQLYAERAPLYEKYADITVDCTGNTVEETVNSVLSALRKRKEQ